MNRASAGWGVAGGGGAVLVGTALPWVTVNTIFFGSVSVDGLSLGDGRAVAIGGALVLALGLVAVNRAKQRRRHHGVAIASVLSAGAVALVGVYDFMQLERLLAEGDDMGLATQGIGLYLVIGGGTIAFVSAFLLPANDEQLAALGPPPPPAGQAGRLVPPSETPPPPPGRGSLPAAQELELLYRLREAGGVTDAEFEATKRRILGEGA